VPSVGAQTAGTGALTGTIKDPSGAVIPNATVTATSVDTGQVRTSPTGADGTYRLTLLPPGNYRVRIEAGGPVEMSLEKLIKIRENKNLEFRVEFYNTFNHPQLANVVDTDANDRAANGGGLETLTTLL